MAGKSPAEAVEAFPARMRSALGCISTATAYVSHIRPDEPAVLAIYAEGQREPGKIRLATHGGEGDLYLRMAQAFAIRHVPGDGAHGHFRVEPSFYQYLILDFAGTEIIAYDWHPSDASPHRTPHLHVSALGTIVLGQRRGSRRAGWKTYPGSMHLPTGRVFLEDLVELLITEFQVDPLRVNWRAILDANREEIARSRTW